MKYKKMCVDESSKDRSVRIRDSADTALTHNTLSVTLVTRKAILRATCTVI
jgi:hypothetical protein